MTTEPDKTFVLFLTPSQDPQRAAVKTELASMRISLSCQSDQYIRQKFFIWQERECCNKNPNTHSLCSKANSCQTKGYAFGAVNAQVKKRNCIKDKQRSRHTCKYLSLTVLLGRSLLGCHLDILNMAYFQERVNLSPSRSKGQWSIPFL